MRVQVLHYLRRAEELARLGNTGIDEDSMTWSREILLAGQPDGGSALCPNGAGLLYVHAGIAMTDALLILLTGSRSTAQDHAEAALRLQKACGRRQRTTEGIKHFEWLVRKKDFFAYDDKRVSLDDAKEAKTKIERFLTWAFKAFPEIAADE